MKLSVLMITYNQESTIREALDSVWAQTTDFDFEVVIGEDCSTDSTRAAIQTYEKRYPGKIRGLYRDPNLGMIENFIQTYRACKGEYIALLEGDDYWIDPLKLQKQVDFLDRRPSYALCFHDAYSRTDDCNIEAMPRSCSPQQKPTSNFVELLADNFIPCCSVMWRNLGSDARFPDGLHQLKLGDWPIHLMHAQRGLIGYLPEAMAVYRVSSNGVWSSLDLKTRLSAMIDAYKMLDTHFEHRYGALIQRLIAFLELFLRFRDIEQRLMDEDKELHQVRHELKLYREAMDHLLAGRGVRLGMKLAKLAAIPKRFLHSFQRFVSMRPKI